LAGQDPPEIPLARQFGPELLLCGQIGAIPPLKFTLLALSGMDPGCRRLVRARKLHLRRIQSFAVPETRPRRLISWHCSIFQPVRRDSSASCTPSFATCLAKVLSNETASGAALRDLRTNNLVEHFYDLKKRSRAGLQKKHALF
jgi:hypothetical protein